MQIHQLKASEEALRLSKRAKTVAALSPQQRQMISEVSQEMRNYVVRVIKFPSRNWEAWSENPGTACGMIVPKLSWPPGCTIDHKRDVWSALIAPSLNRMLTHAKNKITQPMRQVYNGEMLCHSLYNGIMCSYLT